MVRAMREGKPVRLEKISTVADGLAAPVVGDLNLSFVQKYVDDIVLVPDGEIIEAVKILLQRAKVLVEPAGAAGTAALISGRIENIQRKRVVLILSGGNLSLDLLKQWM
jgi:threonine dehydratase